MVWKTKKRPDFVLAFCKMAGWTGLEPATSGVTGRRSNQLNYHPSGKLKWSKKFILQGLSMWKRKFFLCRFMTEENPGEQGRSVLELEWLSYLFLWPLGLVMRVWGRTLRFRFRSDADRLALYYQQEPAVILLWHNRLFLAAEIYRRFRPGRKVFGIVSASKDGAWLAAFFRMMGIGAVRGSRHFRGTAAFRELFDNLKAGHDVAVTPDGSRGPCYDMKAGAFLVARIAKSPVLLLCPNFTSAWRLKSWDGFYLPKPFSMVEVRCELLNGLDASGVPKEKDLGAAELKRRMDGMTVDLDGGS